MIKGRLHQLKRALPYKCNAQLMTQNKTKITNKQNNTVLTIQSFKQCLKISN